jgi:hypothetical protein
MSNELMVAVVERVVTLMSGLVFESRSDRNKVLFRLLAAEGLHCSSGSVAWQFANWLLDGEPVPVAPPVKAAPPKAPKAAPKRPVAAVLPDPATVPAGTVRRGLKDAKKNRQVCAWRSSRGASGAAFWRYAGE